MRRKYSVLVLGTLSVPRAGGSSLDCWVSHSVIFRRLFDLEVVRVAVAIAAPVSGWPGQLRVLKFNVETSFALLVFLSRLLKWVGRATASLAS